MKNIFQLSGDATVSADVPQVCARCDFKKLYRQVDFRKSIGISLVVIASFLSFYFLYYGENWFLTWSPFVVVLIIDRFFNATSAWAAICYSCEHIHRGFNKKDAYKLTDFDLELHDQIKYKEEEA